ncbi:MAG: transcriptional repressor [Spirochaetes bacterium]|nr:transcriptional repressor [Spirochaetota bacterium]
MVEKLASIENAKTFLNDVGINPSYQRLRILDYLINNLCHPTVDMIYSELIREIPTLSKTTVYNTLNLFQKRGIILGLTIDESEVRYESNVVPHAHFKCERCGEIIDVHVCHPILTKGFVNNHKIHEGHLYLKGVCKDCINHDSNGGQK